MNLSSAVADGSHGVRHRVLPSDMSAANAALRAARRERAIALSGLSAGVLGVSDLVELASNDAVALRRIPLRTILAELGVSKRRCDELLAVFRRIVTTPASRVRAQKLTLGWVRDRRAGDGRTTALSDVVVACTKGSRFVADGWPYSPMGAVSDDLAQRSS